MGENLLFLEVVDHRIDEHTEKCRETHQEKWLVEYEVAQACLDFEECLGGFLEIFRMISDFNQSWRQNVFTGRKSPCAEAEAGIKALFEKWLGAESVFRDVLTFFEGQNYSEGVRGVGKYRQYLKAARITLAEWKSPELSPAIGHHRVALNAEQSNKFRALLSVSRPA